MEPRLAAWIAKSLIEVDFSREVEETRSAADTNYDASCER